MNRKAMRGRSGYMLPMVLSALVLDVRAQNSVDITLVPVQESNLEVRLRFADAFDGYFAASVFTIQWDEATGASLGQVQQEAQVQEYHDVSLSGDMLTDNGYRYQVFAGFGGMVLSDIPLTLPAGEWITLCTIPVTGAGEFHIVNNAFTASVNGDYYISLGGQESQGDILSIITSVTGPAESSGGLCVYPTPTSGPIRIESGPPNARPVELTLLDAAGRILWSAALSGSGAPLSIPIDLSAMPSGIYVVRMRSFREDQRARVVKY